MNSRLKMLFFRYSRSLKQQCIDGDVLIAKKVKLFASTSNVYRANINDQVKYVRIIRKHVCLEEYLEESINNYFSIALAGCNERARRAALDDIKEESNFKIIKNVKRLFEINKDSIRNNAFFDYQTAGFPSLKDKGFDDHFCDFLTYLRGEVFNYNNNFNLRNGDYETFNANLQIATRKVAEMLSLEHLIPNVEFGQVDIFGKIYLCTVMDESLGICAASIPIIDRSNFSRRFLDNISDLELLDAICFQTDHKMKNYNVIVNANGLCDGISSFDNDCATTFSPVPFFPRHISLNNNFESIEKQWQFNRPYFNLHFLSSLKSVNYGLVSRTVGDYLTRLQVVFLFVRILRLKRILMRFYKEAKIKNYDICTFANVDSVLSTGNNKGMLLDEKYGCTYLKYFLTTDEKQYYSGDRI